MSIALFIIFLFMNFFILLIMKFVYTSNYSYTEGMLLGVHIPKEHIEDETILNIVAAARRKMNRIIWINLILGTACALSYSGRSLYSYWHTLSG